MGVWSRYVFRPRELTRTKSIKLASDPESINTGVTIVCRGEVRVTETGSLAGLEINKVLLVNTFTLLGGAGPLPRAGDDIMSAQSTVKAPPLHHAALSFLKRETGAPQLHGLLRRSCARPGRR